MSQRLVIFIMLCFLASNACEADASELWQAFLQGQADARASDLPDYSYAGYALGEKSIPPAGGRVFNVTRFGAVANDEQSDRTAIEKAIRAAEENGGGIVFFPPGVFLVNEESGAGDGILIHGAKVILKGSGSGPGGTELFMRNHLHPRNPKKLYSVPHMFQFRPRNPSAVNRARTTVTKDAPRGSFSITVQDSASLKAGMLVELSMNNPKANAAFLAGLKTWPLWTTTNEKGVKVRGERHRIKAIQGNRLTFCEPIHCHLRVEHGWNVSTSDLIPGWVVEDIHFRGNWKEAFKHHKDFVHDSGWMFLSFFYGEYPVLRRCRFTDCSAAAKLSACYGGTILNCSIEGNRGHASFASAYFSYGSLMAFCTDTVKGGAFHGFGANHGSVGTVITHCKNSDRGFDWHASWPYSTLIDNCTGGLIANGGNYAVLPNHMQHLTLWNFKQTAGKVYKDFDWWAPYQGVKKYGGPKIVNPIIVGYHGLQTTFKPDSCLHIESHGKPVKPVSLYIAQLAARLGKRPAWLEQAGGACDFFRKNGYWQKAK